MVFQRIISRFPARGRFSGQPQRSCLTKSNAFVKLSGQFPEPLSQIAQKRDMFSGISENYKGPTRLLHNTTPKILGNLCTKLGFTSSIHSVGPKEFERVVDNGPIDSETNPGHFNGPNQRSDEINRSRPLFEPGRNIGLYESLTRRFSDMDRNRAPNEMVRDGRSFDFGRNMNRVSGLNKDNENYRSGIEQNADIVHVKIMRNNTFVTVTDSKGNKKLGASAGALAEMKGGPKVSKYSAEATAEHVGREAKRMGLKSVVVKVNGFTFFKKKKLAILSFRDGYTNSRSDKNPIVYIEDTTRKPHNGCRRKKQRRV